MRMAPIVPRNYDATPSPRENCRNHNIRAAAAVKRAQQVPSCCSRNSDHGGRVQPFRAGVPALVQIAREMVPPDFTRWQAWLQPLVDTLAMSIGGTAIAIVLSLPLAVCAASTTAPNGVVYQLARLLLNLFRENVPAWLQGGTGA